MIGVEPGRGSGLFFVVPETLVVLISAVGFLFPRLHLVEQELPGHRRPSSATFVSPCFTLATLLEGAFTWDRDHAHPTLPSGSLV
jgi:hypothetical protein